MSIPMFKIYGYFKREAKANDFRAFGHPRAVKEHAEILMKNPNISVIVIENPDNNHRFKWDSTGTRKWFELSKPQDPNTIKAIDQIRREFQASISKPPQVIRGSNLVIKVGGQVVATAKGTSYTINHGKEIKLK